MGNRRIPLESPAFQACVLLLDILLAVEYILNIHTMNINFTFAKERYA